MELKLVHFLGPILAITALLFYGSILVDKTGRKRMRIFPALGLMLGAIAVRIFFQEGTFLDRLCLVLMDFGIAMIVDAGYLAYHRSHSKIYWVPGVLALLVSFAIYFVASLFGWTVNSMFADDPVVAEQQLVAPLPPRTEQIPTPVEVHSEWAEVLLELGPDDDIQELGGVLAEFEAEFVDAFPSIDLEEDEDLAQYFLVTLPVGNLNPFLQRTMSDRENVDSSEPNELISLNEPKATEAPENAGPFTANDPGIGKQWWMPAEKSNAIHQLLRDHPPVRKARVAIVDSGLDEAHEDLASVRTGQAVGDINGHGTHCAGLAGAATNNGLGMASLNWEGKFIELRGYKALGDNGSGTHWQIAKAIVAAAEDKADVISLSLGTFAPRAPKVLRDAVEFAQQEGCIVVAAAGNDYGEDAINHAPSNIEGVIAVAAITPDMERSPFSNTNTSLKFPLAAPGSSIWSCVPEGGYDYKNGTSMATPLVAGLLGIVRAYQPETPAAEAWKLLHEYAVEIPASVEVGRVIDPLPVIQALTGKKSGI